MAEEFDSLAEFEVTVTTKDGAAFMARARNSRSVRTIQIVACPDNPRLIGDYFTLPNWEKN